MVDPCIFVVAGGAGTGGEGVVKPIRVPLGGALATTMPNKAQSCIPSPLLLLSVHWPMLQSPDLAGLIQTAMQL